MHFIKSNAEEITEVNPYKKVERIGRICYKSEDKITADSYKKFVSNLIKRKHYAMLEHARLFFNIEIRDEDGAAEVRGMDIMNDLANIPAVYTYFDGMGRSVDIGVDVSLSHLYNDRWKTLPYCNAIAILDALRIVAEDYFEFHVEGDDFDRSSTIANLKELNDLELSNIKYIPTFNEDGVSTFSYPECRYVSVKFNCDRGVSHELIRHRCAVAQSSTRYCNYSKDKFGNGDIAFVYPHDYESWDNDVKILFEKNLQECEDTYNYMIGEGMSPQQARAILPNGLATEVVLTMNVAQWKHFIDLRYKGTTGAPHPDMKDVAKVAYDHILKPYIERVVDFYFEPLKDSDN